MNNEFKFIQFAILKHKYLANIMQFSTYLKKQVKCNTYIIIKCNFIIILFYIILLYIILKLHI